MLLIRRQLALGKERIIKRERIVKKKELFRGNGSCIRNSGEYISIDVLCCCVYTDTFDCQRVALSD